MGKVRRSFGWLRKLPSGRFQASYKGPDLFRHVAPVTFDTELDGEAWLAAESRLISAGTWTSPAARERARHERGLTLDEVATTYIDSRDLRPRTQADYDRLLEKFIRPALGGMPVREITEATVATWYARLNRNTPTERAHAYQLLRAVLNEAVELRLIPSNPAHIRGAGQVKRAHSIKPASLRELEVIVANMPERYRLSVLLAAWCALRYGEIAELRRKDFTIPPEASGGPAKVRISRGVTWPESASKPVVGPPKTAAGVREVAIPPHLLPAVRDHLKTHAQWGRDGLLFPSKSNGQQIHHANVGKRFRRACEIAGRPDLHFHDLRHTGAVLAASTGATLAELMARLGHATAGAAMRYQHAAQDRDFVIAAQLSALATGQPKPPAETPEGEKVTGAAG